MIPTANNSREWAYDFGCDQSLEDVLDHFNQAGPWAWTGRDSYIEGNYLNSRPVDGVRIKVNQYPQAFITDRKGSGYSALIRTDSDDVEFRLGLDQKLKRLLELIDAKDVVAIDVYD